ncbi:hypothetical protein [Paenarthrobacter sp. A20]|uniref:hypothetical protein n=1 Tax=Paenarthrobacter sp. A20 TaxID=2817891 RepID=UPI00209F7BAE|nr:hypothetical protein [Paenarthrobacter sp. A20]MCP1414382.1 hypothetical protein [Paenarthrobacter sp. A20]
MSATDELEQDVRKALPLNTDPEAIAHHVATWLHNDGYTKPTNEQTAAVQAMARIREAMDALFKGQSTQIEALGQIAEHLGAYEIERI